MTEEKESEERVARLFGLEPSSVRFQTAVTHPSYAHEVAGALDNQRLEFLGDAILDFMVSEELYRRFPDSDEGKLTRVRAQIVSTGALARFARHYQISDALRFGKGAGQGSLHDSDNVLADAVEALIAAGYLDAGAEQARKICLEVLGFGMEAVQKVGARDVKSDLQEKVQALGLKAPVYRVVSSSGPAHEVVFEVEVSVKGTILASGKGRSKRLAERQAAQAALDDSGYEKLALGASAGGNS